MKKEDMLKENFMNMQTEYQVSHRNVCRKIDNVFVNELKHFKTLLIQFNEDNKCMEPNQIYLTCDKIKEIFNTSKIILIEDYESRFKANVDKLTFNMYGFFYKKLLNRNVKNPINSLNKALVEICKFDYLLIQDKVENDLLEFSDDFIYRYINNDEASQEVKRLVKNVSYTLICELKKVINESIEDKQNIAMRYNSLYKEVLNKKEEVR